MNTGGLKMAFYMLQMNYPSETIKSLINKPEDRMSAAASLMESIGGKLHHMLMAQGECDVVVICEIPDTISAVAMGMLVASSGAVENFKTTPLLTWDEAMEAMKKAGNISGYKPIGS